MRKILYNMPAVLIGMLYVLLTALAEGISGFQPVAYLYISLPVLAGFFLRRNQWWGCLFGIVMGALLVYNGMTAQPQMIVSFVTGLILVAYYVAMGIVCAASQKKK